MYTNDTIRLQRGRIFFVTTKKQIAWLRKITFRDIADPRRAATRRSHGCPRCGDISHGSIPFQELRTRGQPLRPERRGQHLHPAAKPDYDRIRATHRRPVRCRGGAGRLFGHVGHTHRRALAGGRGRQHRRLAVPLRRHLHPVPHFAAQARHRLPHRPKRTPRGLRGADRRTHEGDLRREHGQSHLYGARSRSTGTTGQTLRRALRRGQYVRCRGLPVQPLRMGCEHRRRLGDQMDQRPRHGHGRGDRRRGAITTGPTASSRRSTARRKGITD